MNLLWFVYTLAIIVVAITACATSMTLWMFTEWRECIFAAAAFTAYILDIAVILFDEYIQGKVEPQIYLSHAGLSHPALTVIVATVLVGSAWAWGLTRLHRTIDWRQFAVAMILFLVVEALLCPTEGHAGRMRTFLFWGLRDGVLIAIVVYGFWYVVRNPHKADKLGLSRAASFYRVILVLLVLVLAEDIVAILLLQPDFDNPTVREFFWHMGQRNIFENITMVVLAVRKMIYDRDVTRIYARHPAEREDALEHEGTLHDFETRLLKYCDDHGMSMRERDVLERAVRGRDTQGIASDLYISAGTVKAHMHRIYTKAGVANRQELVNAFWKY